MYKIPANTLFLGKNLVFVPECHSTNTLALQLCQQPGILEGTVVITDHQTAGRGQRGNSWEALPGQNLTFSMIFKPTFIEPSRQFHLNRAVSLGLWDFLRGKLTQEVKIKWPNDMVVGNQKVSGMLIENIIQGSTLNFSVAGVGLNVNQCNFSSDRATSLQLLSGLETPLDKAFEELMTLIEYRYLMLKRNVRELEREYLAALLGMEEPRRFRWEENEHDGTITGVDEAGRLRVQTAAGDRTFGIKEIEFVF